jgi:alpha-tubulin suppressor-like RCC1 family protein
VYTWGSNNNYQLGYPCRSDNIKHPRKVYFSEENKYVDLTSIKNAAVSKTKTLALTDVGELYSWGTDYDGKGYMVSPYKVDIDFDRDIQRKELTLTQSEYAVLKKLAKNVLQYYEQLKEELSWVSRERKGSANKFEMSPEYFLTKIVVHKVACSNKHNLLVT